jgi:hypothetical protein
MSQIRPDHPKTTHHDSILSFLAAQDDPPDLRICQDSDRPRPSGATPRSRAGSDDARSGPRPGRWLRRRDPVRARGPYGPPGREGTVRARGPSGPPRRERTTITACWLRQHRETSTTKGAAIAGAAQLVNERTTITARWLRQRRETTATPPDGPARRRRRPHVEHKAPDLPRVPFSIQRLFYKVSCSPPPGRASGNRVLRKRLPVMVLGPGLAAACAVSGVEIPPPTRPREEGGIRATCKIRGAAPGRAEGIGGQPFEKGFSPEPLFQSFLATCGASRHPSLWKRGSGKTQGPLSTPNSELRAPPAHPRREGQIHPRPDRRSPPGQRRNAPNPPSRAGKGRSSDGPARGIGSRDGAGLPGLARPRRLVLQSNGGSTCTSTPST